MARKTWWINTREGFEKSSLSKLRKSPKGTVYGYSSGTRRGVNSKSKGSGKLDTTY